MFHFICVCSMYNHLRRKYNSIFGGPNPIYELVHHGPHLNRAELMSYIFNHPHQLTLARALNEMYAERKRLLGSVNAAPAPDPYGDVGVEYDTNAPALHELGSPRVRPEVMRLAMSEDVAASVASLRALAVSIQIWPNP